MTRTHRGSPILPGVLVGLALSLVASHALAQGPVIPLPDDVAQDLKLLGEGVVGKPVPAPALDDLIGLYMGSPDGGTWTYHVIKGGEKHVRVESIVASGDRGGMKTWKQQIGDQYVQHMIKHSDGSLGKFGEDDLELSYGSHFQPGIFLSSRLEPGQSQEVKGKALAYKSDDPDDVSYTGTMDTTLTYVGAYEVTTPAGTWPASLIRAEFDIKIGPAKVKDVQYSFYSKGVGKIAEVEALRVSALLVYHSNDKTAKVLAKQPTLGKQLPGN